MSQKGCVLTKGTQNSVVNDVCTRELFHSTSTSSSNGGTTISNNTSSTGGFSCSSSSLECNSNDLTSSGMSSPLALPFAHCCKLSPPLKLQYAGCKTSPPLNLPSTDSKSSSSPSSLRKADHDNRCVKRSMGLMKLRRQGSHPPPPASRSSNKICHGSINQAAAARELMVSLERLSLNGKTMGTSAERETEAKRTLLGVDQSEESVYAEGSSRNGMKMELPLTAKIAAAMDAEGLVGVQEEISLQCSKLYASRLPRSFGDQYSHPSSFKTCRSRKPRPAAASGDCCEIRPVAARKMHSTLSSKRRSRWIILRRLRSTRAMLGKIWRNLKKVFSSSSSRKRKLLQEVNT